jgi:hypothetical protein
MTQPPVPLSSSRQLIAALRQQGVSMSEIAAECDRDSSLLYQVAPGNGPALTSCRPRSRPHRARLTTPRATHDPHR